MPVHNAGPYLDRAVASILAQSFGDFEFVILDDGSTDGSRLRLREWASRDGRIRLLEGPRKSGPVESSNTVVREARAALVARMDADDVACADRLKLQMAALAADSGAVLVGALSETIDRTGRVIRSPDYAHLFRDSRLVPFAHSSAMFRKPVFEKLGGYRSIACRWEEVDLFLRMAGLGRVLIVTRALMQVRLSEHSSRAVASAGELDRAMDRMYRTLADGPAPDAGRLLPQSFVPGAAVHLWTGRRPRVLGRLLRHGDLGLDVATARALVWSAWADVSPRTLRLLLGRLAALRNAAARKRLGAREIVEWRPPIATIAPGMRRSSPDRHRSG